MRQLTSRSQAEGKLTVLHFQVNHLSHWQIAHDLVKEQRRRRRQGNTGASQNTRVIFMSSFMEMGGVINLNDLQLEREPYSGFRGYCASKLENVLTAKHMQRLFAR